MSANAASAAPISSPAPPRAPRAGQSAVAGGHDVNGTGELDLARRLLVGARGADPQLDRAGLDDALTARGR